MRRKEVEDTIPAMVNLLKNVEYQMENSRRTENHLTFVSLLFLSGLRRVRRLEALT